jgi:hypothetical protein
MAAEFRLPKLLLEAEAAVLLRRSCGHVKRLRLEGKLGYLRRRPVLIDEKDLEAYIAHAKRRRVLRTKKLIRQGNRAKGRSETFEYVPAGATPGPFKLLTIAEAAAKFERTPRQIRYLCLRGRIPYIVGRPPLIDEADIAEHCERKHAADLAKIPRVPGTPESEALRERKTRERIAFRLRKIAVRREVKRILAAMASRAGK